jgi:metal-responsive CopG/Arc/MetJ family transcriptional regulator
MKAEPFLILSFRLPEPLIQRVDTQAEKETRTRTNMVTVLLQEALDERQKPMGKTQRAFYAYLKSQRKGK